MGHDHNHLVGQLLWEARGASPLAGSSMAREARTWLVWDSEHQMQLFNRQGEPIATRLWNRALRAAAISDDGGTVVALPEGDELWWLNDELEEVFRYRVLPRSVAVAVDATGWHAAVAETTGQNIIADCQGRRLANFRTARPLRLLEFSADQPLLIACGEAGPLGAFDLRGTRRWHTELLGRFDGLATAADGVFLAAPSAGLYTFDALGRSGGVRLQATPPTCVAASVDGSRLLVGRETGELNLIDRGGRRLWSATLDEPIRTVHLDLLGTSARIGLNSGRLLHFRFVESAEQ